MAKNDYLKIKDGFGEEFAKFCRSTFPEIIERNELYDLITQTFLPSRNLWLDIKENEVEDEFKNFIYGKVESQQIQTQENIESPEVLMKKAGYILKRCTTERQVEEYKKYYKPDEELCTFGNITGRLGYCDIFFAVKENVDEIKRENFEYPKRQDEYGTSVISLQFTKGVSRTLSIKNRYNHTVSNPDATFSNDLENIYPGLTESFKKYYGIDLQHNEGNFELEGYVFANDEKYYKFNHEIDDVYFCPNNIVIKEYKAKQYDKSRYEVIDYFLLDKKKKTLINLIQDEDSFVEQFKEIQKFDIQKINSNGDRLIKITTEEYPDIQITVDSCNRMIGFSNPDLKIINDHFLTYQEKIKELNLPNVTAIGDYCFKWNDDLQTVNFPLLTKVGDDFLYYNKMLIDLKMPKLESVGDEFLCGNRLLTTFDAPCLKTVGASFLFSDFNLNQINLPMLQSCGVAFLYENLALKQIYLPNLETVGNSFLRENKKLSKIEIPKLKTVGDYFLCNNQELNELDIPELISVGDYFLYDNTKLVNIKTPELKTVGYRFLQCNKYLKKLDMPQLEDAGGFFLQENQILKEFNAPNLKSVGSCFLFENKSLESLDLPSLEVLKEQFLHNNEKIKKLKLDNLREVGDLFLSRNKKLQELELPNAQEIGSVFLVNNKVLSKISLPKVEYIGDKFLLTNQSLTDFSAPNLKSIEDYFMNGNETLKTFDAPNLENIGFCFLSDNEVLESFNAPKLTSIYSAFLTSNKALKELYLPDLTTCDGDEPEFLSRNKALEKLYVPKLDRKKLNGFLENHPNREELIKNSKNLKKNFVEKYKTKKPLRILFKKISNIFDNHRKDDGMQK